MAKWETWQIPFELVAPAHQSAEDAETGLGNKLATGDGDKIKTVDITRWQKGHRLRWELSVGLAAADWISVEKVKKLKFVKG